MTTKTENSVSTWRIDPAHSQVGFTVKHMMFTTVRGRFGGVSGTIVVEESSPDASRVEVEIDTASIDTQVADRDAHLRSADFFDAESHPRLVFRSRRVEGAAKQPGERFKVIGDLTIRGTTREVVLEATYDGQGTDPWGGQRVGFTAETTIDRRDYGLTWNQALEAGGVLVSNEVKIHLEVQAAAADQG